MKQLIFLSFAILMLVSCKKEKQKEIVKDKYRSYDGALNADRNGKKWNPKSLAVTNDTIFSINIVDYHDDMEWDKASIGTIPLKQGTYILEDYMIWKYFDSTNSISNDAVLAYYNGSFGHGADVSNLCFLRKDRPHFITVNSYNNDTKMINCTFSCSFIIDSKSMGKGLDTISYTNATFTGKVWHEDELPK